MSGPMDWREKALRLAALGFSTRQIAHDLGIDRRRLARLLNPAQAEQHRAYNRVYSRRPEVMKRRRARRAAESPEERSAFVVRRKAWLLALDTGRPRAEVYAEAGVPYRRPPMSVMSVSSGQLD